MRCLLIKTDAQGNELWRKKISKAAPNVQDGKAIIQDSATGKIAIIGTQYLSQPGPYGNILILDSLGNEENRQTFIRGIVQDMVQLEDQSFVLVGFAEILLPESVTSYRGYVARFTFDTGTFPKWNIKLLPESGLSCIKILPDGQLLAMGWHSTMDSIYYMDHDLIRATKIDTTGVVIWDKTYDYKFNAPKAHFIVGPRAFELTSDGGWVAAIELFNTTYPNPFFFVKYDSTGCDSTTAYCESLVAGVNEMRQSAPVTFELFPNPAADHLSVVLPATHKAEYELSFSDATGKEAMRAKLSSTTDNVDISRLQSGLYFVSLRSGNRTFCSKKLVIRR